MDSKQSFPPADAGRNPTPVNPAEPAVAPQPTVAQPVTNVAQQPTASGGNKKLWIIVGLIALILILGGAYWLIIKQRPTETPRPSPTVSAETVDTLENQLNAVSLEDLDQEFSSVDTDLKGL